MFRRGAQQGVLASLLVKNAIEIAGEVRSSAPGLLRCPKPSELRESVGKPWGPPSVEDFMLRTGLRV